MADSTDIAGHGELKGVLFDLDGTLIDTYGLILASFRHATMEVLGHTFPDEVLMAKVGIPLAEEMKDFSDDPAVQDELVRVYRAYNEAIHDERVTPFAGVREMLDAVHERGLLIGVVTSKRGPLARRGVAVCGLGEHVLFTIGSDECPQHKPDPAPILMGCERLGLAPSECAYVGDSPFDIQAGNAAGCRTVAATWGMFPEEALVAQCPDAVAATPSQVLAGLGLA